MKDMRRMTSAQVQCHMMIIDDIMWDVIGDLTILVMLNIF